MTRSGDKVKISRNSAHGRVVADFTITNIEGIGKVAAVDAFTIQFKDRPPAARTEEAAYYAVVDLQNLIPPSFPR